MIRFLKKWIGVIVSPSTTSNQQNIQLPSDIDLIKQPVIDADSFEVPPSDLDNDDAVITNIDTVNVESDCQVSNDYKDKIALTRTETTESLLDNIQYVKLIESHCEIMDELDMYRERVTNDEAIKIIDIIHHRLLESAYLSGATPIKDEDRYNHLRHVTVPISMPNNDALIGHTIKPGIAVEDRVLIRAKVTLIK